MTSDKKILQVIMYIQKFSLLSTDDKYVFTNHRRTSHTIIKIIIIWSIHSFDILLQI